MTQTSAAIDQPYDQADRPEIRRLMVFFALVYVAEGLGQTGGLIAQPLNYYLKQALGWTPVQVTACLTVLSFPWFIKPLYGIISDFVPLFGFRRKTYLLLANAVAALAYFWVMRVTKRGELVFLLLLTAYGMAISSTLCGAVLVENGQRFRASGAFVNQQWLWYNVAAVAASLIGGILIQRLPAASALHGAAAIIAFAPLAVVLGSWFLVKEDKSAINVATLKGTFHSFTGIFKSKQLWIIVLFLFCYNFSPGFATPLYYHMTDKLKFSQFYIGALGAISSVGWIIGGLVYSRFLKRLTSKNVLNLSIALGVVGTLAYLGLSEQISAAVVSFIAGVAGMITYVASLTLAADYCPKQSEGFAYAVLMSISNIAGSASDNLGSFLYEHVFRNQLAPLIWVSALFTAFAFALVPLLRLGGKRQGDPVHDVTADQGAARQLAP